MNIYEDYVDRLYMSRKEGERAFASLQDTLIHRLEDYIKRENKD